MRPVFFGGLSHEADVRDGTHGAGIECAVFFTEVDGGLENAGIAGIWDDGEGVARFPGGVPDFSARTNHGGHGGIHDDVTRDVEVGDAFFGIDHREGGAVGVGELDVGLDLGFLVGGEFFDFCDKVTEAVAEIDAEFLDGCGVLGDEILEEDLDGMAENDRVTDLHHRSLEVEREQ